jgi:hypothetical protein
MFEHLEIPKNDPDQILQREILAALEELIRSAGPDGLILDQKYNIKITMAFAKWEIPWARL